MLTVRMATAPGPKPLPGSLRVELGGLDSTGPISLPMPPQGTAVTSDPLPAPAKESTFQLQISYFLDEKRVSVLVKGVGPDDSISIFAFGTEQSAKEPPGVLYVGKIVHRNRGVPRDCGVRCEQGAPTFEECCVICRNENIVTETCC
jgi:hypothetical protein